MGGFIAMPRGWMDDGMFPSVGREPFCHRAAWAWLVERAAFCSQTVRYHGKDFALERGQIVLSLQDMGSVWGWNTRKVARGLSAWQRAAATVMVSVTVGMLITICNYDEMQSSEKTTVMPVTSERDTERPATVTDLITNKPSKPRKEDSAILAEFAAWYAAFPRHVGKGDAEKAYRRARREVSAAELLAAVERYRTGKPAYADWAHPATWLNKKRWLDEYGDTNAEPARDRPTGPPPPLLLAHGG